MATTKKKIEYVTEDGDEVEVELPAVFEVCDRCDGKGKHDHPAFNGFTQEDMDEDPDFREDYFRGVYDVACTVCHGQRVVAEVAERELNAEQKAHYAAYLKAQREIAESYAIERAERAMGA